jgi:TolA-binding protein
MRRWVVVAPAALMLGGGCLASKSDVRLLQDELRATRAQLAVGDTAILRSQEQRRMQIGALSAQVDRMLDSLRTVATRLANFQATASGNFEAMNTQMLQMQAMLGQTTRNLQETRNQMQALREQTVAPAAPPAGGTDTSSRGGAAGVPGPATLYSGAVESINSGAYTTGRRALDQLLASYPNDELAPRAQLKVGDTYKAERNLAAADSVYRLVDERYPRAPEAATALYLRGKPLWDANRRNEARVLFNRILRDFPKSTEAGLVNDLTRP